MELVGTPLWGFDPAMNVLAQPAISNTTIEKI